MQPGVCSALYGTQSARLQAPTRPQAIDTLASALAEVGQVFDAPRFTSLAMQGLEELELKERVRHLIDCLHQTLPQPFPEALSFVLAAVELDAVRPEEERQLRGFVAWPLIDYIGAHGIEHPELALEGLRATTERFSAEFAIRQYIEQFQGITIEYLKRWLRDSNHHVRRLVSEGTRPLLPWGLRLGTLRRNPEPILQLLEELRADSSEYVRRSVANNLNDISKDHPELVVETCRRWLEEADRDRERLVRHALRTLVKSGHRGALELLGCGGKPDIELVAPRLSPQAIREGDNIELEFGLCSTSTRSQLLNVDYALHFVRANGSLSPKVFKLRKLSLGPGQSIAIRKQHSFKPVGIDPLPWTGLLSRQHGD